ncbi:hypothetical protein ANN_00124 [Periplaneta americana]|uniref:Uncharacterized protein n=1 Tax=Periplaneta americana TaxID=6978 RepID=A0ABQ8TR05_PERAM|nr:hypothetical protein ANN_00124 [Periplaneta americana]
MAGLCEGGNEPTAAGNPSLLKPDRNSIWKSLLQARIDIRRWEKKTKRLKNDVGCKTSNLQTYPSKLNTELASKHRVVAL